MKEAELKSAVEDYLTYQMNMGKLYFDRLNSGDFIEVRGNTRRRVKGCRKGTADFFVIKPAYLPRLAGDSIVRLIFLELKGEKGRASPGQGAFKTLVEAQGAEYHIIKSIEELEATLK